MKSDWTVYLLTGSFAEACGSRRVARKGRLPLPLSLPFRGHIIDGVITLQGITLYRFDCEGKEINGCEGNELRARALVYQVKVPTTHPPYLSSYLMVSRNREE